MQIKNNFPILMDLNFNHWKILNPFYKEIPLIETIKTCLIHYASKPQLINDVLEKIETLKCSELVKTIENDINHVVQNNSFEDSKSILRIFDLIQGWGGKMGKAPYVPFENPFRNKYNEWINDYIEGIKLSLIGNPDGLLYFKKIPKIGESFGSKHLHFWSKFGGAKIPIPIYDARIQSLLYCDMKSKPSYQSYINDMKIFSKHLNLSIVDVEVALFAFSSNYFPNNTLKIKDNLKDKTDINIARKLSKKCL